MMTSSTSNLFGAVFSVVFLAALPLAASQESVSPAVDAGSKPVVTADNKECVDCHRKSSPAMVMEWERSGHAQYGVGCVDCHAAAEGEADAWFHAGAWVAALVTPLDCSNCHEREFEEFSKSHHAKAGEILASLDNVLAEKVAGTPDNLADAVNGCWQCHGSIIRFERDEAGAIVRTSQENKPVIDWQSWPNSGVGRLNPDGSKGSCHACHSRHAFDAKLARSPENCGKCHMGPDHPQIEIFNESKHGIAFHANRDIMALDKEDDWVLGRDYSAAPTCATCHISSFMTPQGEVVGNNHDVGERISWTLRPVVSSKLNLVIFEDGFKEDFPESRELPEIGATLETTEKIVENEQLVGRTVPRRVAQVVTWEERRNKMQGACLNCHNDTYVNNFYRQFDSLVELYNDKFAIPAKKFMTDLLADGVLRKEAPFEKDVQWVFWELWHHEGRRARHGASMMGPDYTHWHGMYEVSKHFYIEFLPAVIEAAEEHSPAMGAKYAAKVAELMSLPENTWMEGLSAAEAEELRKAYAERYNQ
jgi:hypothetical protein